MNERYKHYTNIINSYQTMGCSNDGSKVTSSVDQWFLNLYSCVVLLQFSAKIIIITMATFIRFLIQYVSQSVSDFRLWALSSSSTQTESGNNCGSSCS